MSSYKGGETTRPKSVQRKFGGGGEDLKLTNTVMGKFFLQRKSFRKFFYLLVFGAQVVFTFSRMYMELESITTTF